MERLTPIERARNLIFREYPGFSDYVSTMLQDLQFGENDEACTEDREVRDTGTIYTLGDEPFGCCLALWKRFNADCVWSIDQALKLEPGEPGLQYAGGRYMTPERIGSTLWLAVTGSGVTFTDDGDAPALQRMAEWARANHREGAYFGDDGAVYLI